MKIFILFLFGIFQFQAIGQHLDSLSQTKLPINKIVTKRDEWDVIDEFSSIDTNIVHVLMVDFFQDITINSIKDTIIDNFTYNKSILKIIPLDTVGSMQVYETLSDSSSAYKEYKGTGKTLVQKWSFYDFKNRKNDYFNYYYFEQLRDGTWKYWNKYGKLEKVRVYEQNVIVKEIKY